MQMTTVSDLPQDLVEQILSRVPLTSLRSTRSTCNYWNCLYRDQSFAKAIAARQPSLGLLVTDAKVSSLTFNLQGIDDGDDPSIRQIRIPNETKVSKIFHCDGLLLCVIKDNPRRLLLWNPYLGQTKWIQTRRHNFDGVSTFALGYDNNRNHKILRISDDCYNEYDRRYEIYDLNSNSWKVLHVIPYWKGWDTQPPQSLKGNTYLVAHAKIPKDRLDNFLLCFDFTTESFRPRMLLPFRSKDDESVTLSCVREEKLAVLHHVWHTSEIMEIWITSKIEPTKVSWSKFLKVDINSITSFPKKFEVGSFFIDEEKKVAVIFAMDEPFPTITCRYQTAHIVGEDGYYKSVDIVEAPTNLRETGCHPLVCSSFVPSLVQLQIKRQGRKRKVRGY